MGLRVGEGLTINSAQAMGASLSVSMTNAKVMHAAQLLDKCLLMLSGMSCNGGQIDAAALVGLFRLSEKFKQYPHQLPVVHKDIDGVQTGVELSREI